MFDRQIQTFDRQIQTSRTSSVLLRSQHMTLTQTRCLSPQKGDVDLNLAWVLDVIIELKGKRSLSFSQARAIAHSHDFRPSCYEVLKLVDCIQVYNSHAPWFCDAIGIRLGVTRETQAIRFSFPRSEKSIFSTQVDPARQTITTARELTEFFAERAEKRSHTLSPKAKARVTD